MDKSVKEHEPEQPKTQPDPAVPQEKPSTPEAAPKPDQPDTAPGKPDSEPVAPLAAGTGSEPTQRPRKPLPSGGGGSGGSKPPSSGTDTARPKPRRLWVAVIALLLALAALALVGFGYYRIQNLHAATQAELNGLQASVSQSRDAAEQARRTASDLSSEVTQVRQQLNDKQQSVDELQDRLTRSMQQISKMQGTSRRDWLLAEVEYLLRLANQRVLMESSAKEALVLLKSADKILQETDDVSIYNVRKALAQDIAELEAVPRLDVEGVFLKLAALNEQVDQLRQVPVTDKGELPDMLKGITPDSVEESWNDGLRASWNRAMEKLGQLVVVQRRDEPVEPLLSPEQNYFLQQNLHLMLEQAQLALLQGKQASYETSIDKATRWIRTYFEADDATTQALLKGLNGLKGVQVSPPLPDISDSLQALKGYLADMHNGKGAA